MKDMYGINVEQTRYSKPISDIPVPDMVISMGCEVGCPYIGRAFDDNWGCWILRVRAMRNLWK